MSGLETTNLPDWQAIHQAHRQAEALGFTDPNLRPIGTVSLEAAFAELAPVIELPALPFPRIPTRTNGFGGRSKTHRFEADLTDTQDSQKDTLFGRLARIDDIEAEVLAEIHGEGRWFFTLVEKVTEDGQGYLAREYVHDQQQIEEIKAHETETLAIALSAFRVEAFERSRRTRGFPSPARTAGDGSGLDNLTSLRSAQNQHSKNKLLHAMIADIEKRQLLETATEPMPRSWGYQIPEWQDHYAADTYF